MVESVGRRERIGEQGNRGTGKGKELYGGAVARAAKSLQELRRKEQLTCGDDAI